MISNVLYLDDHKTYYSDYLLKSGTVSHEKLVEDEHMFETDDLNKIKSNVIIVQVLVQFLTYLFVSNLLNYERYMLKDHPWIHSCSVISHFNAQIYVNHRNAYIKYHLQKSLDLYPNIVFSNPAKNDQRNWWNNSLPACQYPTTIGRLENGINNYLDQYYYHIYPSDHCPLFELVHIH